MYLSLPFTRKIGFPLFLTTVTFICGLDNKFGQVIVPKAHVARSLHMRQYAETVAHQKSAAFLVFMSTLFLAEHTNRLRPDCTGIPQLQQKQGYTPERISKSIQIFVATVSLEFVAVKILGPFLTTVTKKRNLLVMRDRVFKLAKAITLANVATGTVANASVNDGVLANRQPKLFFLENGAQFLFQLIQHVR